MCTLRCSQTTFQGDSGPASLELRPDSFDFGPHAVEIGPNWPIPVQVPPISAEITAVFAELSSPSQTEPTSGVFGLTSVEIGSQLRSHELYAARCEAGRLPDIIVDHGWRMGWDLRLARRR